MVASVECVRGDDASAPRRDVLWLQSEEIIAEAPAEEYNSANSVYACVAMSGFSVVC